MDSTNRWFLSYKRVSNSEALQVIEKLTTKADEIQETLLREILNRNGETEYVRRHMKEVASKDMMITAFKQSVPVVKYQDICSYIKRIADGEHHSVLTGNPITEMLCSSGTSAGEPKLIPSIAEDLDRRAFFYSLIMPIINQYIPGLDKGKGMYLCFVKSETRTPCGLPARAVLTSYYKSSYFRRRNLDEDAFNDLTSPDQTILCEDTTQSMYCQLLSGLLHRRHVTRLGAIFASALLRALTFLEREWPPMCEDIRTGILDARLITDTGCRSSTQELLTKSGPNPKLAAEIEEICGRNSWKGILTSLWPNAKFIEAVITGSMAQYVPALEFYSDGKIPLVCPMYASSESYFGVNLDPLSDPEDVSFTLLPNMCYFEFIPIGRNGTLSSDQDEDDKGVEFKEKVVDLVNVQLGCYYELVVTTFAGLNRYRIGDVLQVTGFHNKAPQFKFICRRNVVLSIDMDKTNEDDLHKSVSSAVKKLLQPQNAILVEYTSYPDASSVPGHYVLFWEIQTHHHPGTKSNAPAAVNGLEAAPVQMDRDLMQDCCLAVEEGLDYIYRQCRAKDRTVGPLEIRVVKPGTFEALMDMIISNGGSINQYKTPRCIKNNVSALKLLNSSVTASFLSPRDPTWIP